MSPDSGASRAEPAATVLRRRVAIPWRGALRRRNFRLFFFGQGVSVTGTWMQAIAQSWLVLTLTKDPFWLGVVSAAQWLPVLVLGLFGGVIADLLPKRTTLVATQVGQLAPALILAVLTFTGVVQLWHVLALGVFLGFVNAIDMPTRQAFVVEMVGREDLTNAVSINSATFNAARVVGPAIGGLVIGGLGVAACFLLNAVSFIAVIGGLLLMDEEELIAGERPARPTSGREVVDQLAEGLRYVRATPVVLLAVVLVGWVATVAMNFNVVIPALADRVLDVGATGLGFLMAALGVGSLVSSLAIATGRRTPRPRSIVLGGLFVGLFSILAGAIHAFAVALVVMFGLGMAAIGMMISANTSIQMVVPDRLRGRVMAVYTTLFAGSTPVGALLTGWAASTWGTPVTLVVSGALAVVASVAAVLWIRRGGLRGTA